MQYPNPKIEPFGLLIFTGTRLVFWAGTYLLFMLNDCECWYLFFSRKIMMLLLLCYLREAFVFSNILYANKA